MSTHHPFSVSQPPFPKKMNESAVRSTGWDALRTKHSMIERGYMKDDFVKYFVDTSKKKKSVRRASPLINRGTYTMFTTKRRRFDSIQNRVLQVRLQEPLRLKRRQEIFYERQRKNVRSLIWELDRPPCFGG